MREKLLAFDKNHFRYSDIVNAMPLIGPWLSHIHSFAPTPAAAPPVV